MQGLRSIFLSLPGVRLVQSCRKSRRYRYFIRLSRVTRKMAKKDGWFEVLFALDRLMACDGLFPKSAIRETASVMKEGQAEAETYLKQLLVARLHNGLVQKYVAGQAGEGAQCVVAPAGWRRYLGRNEMPVRRIVSYLTWCRTVFFWFLSGILRARAILITPKWQAPHAPYNSVMNVNRLSIPQTVTGRTGMFLDWLCRNLDFDADGYWRVLTSAKSEPDPTGRRENVCFELPELPAGQRGSYRMDQCRILLWALIGMMVGRWWRVLLAEERLMDAYFCRLQTNQLAQNYIYTQSNYAVRPLWTYSAVRQGAHCYLVFYSTNIWPFEYRQTQEIPAYPSYRLMTWPHFVTFDGAHTERLQRLCPAARFSSFPHVDFADDWARESDCPKGALILFDVTPRSLTWLSVVGFPPMYYMENTCTDLVSDVVEIAFEAGVKVALKPKRRLSKSDHACSRYEKMLLDLEEAGKLIMLDEAVSAGRHLEKSSMVVSVPFTSTATLARNIGKPTVYYDPTGNLRTPENWNGKNPYKSLANEVEILCGRDELRNWIAKYAETVVNHRED